MHSIPYFPQIDDHTCGPAVVQMVLAAYGIEKDQSTLAKELETPYESDEGTDPNKIIQLLRHNGLIVTEKHPATIADIHQALANQEIVIACYTEPDWEWGHYSIVGEINDEEIVLVDPDPDHGANFKMPTAEFQHRWRDALFTKTNRWMLVVRNERAKE